MRTVDAILTAALATGKGKPYIKGFIGYSNGAVKHTDDLYAYELTGQTLKFHMPYTGDFASDQTHMWLERGLYIGGVKYSVITGRFRIVHQTYLADGSQEAEGHLFPPSFYSAAGDDTYENVITAFCTAFGKTAVFADADAAWRNYQFMADGETIHLTDATKMLNLLAQKRLITLTDNGSEEVLVYCADVMPAVDFTLYPTHDFDIASTNLRARQYIWRDELGVYHQSGTVTNPIHNLGYLEAAAAAPARKSWLYESDYLVPPNFEYQDGDTIKFIMYGGSSLFTFFARIVEKYDPRSKSEPAWRTHIQANPIFENTEGGWYPPGMLNQLNTLPLNTSSFKHSLTANENNLQAAIDKLDQGSVQFLTSTLEFYRGNLLTFTPFTATINGAPGATTLVYNAPTAGYDSDLLQYDSGGVLTAGNIAKMTLYNTTRGTSALILSVVTATKTITLTGNVPAGWANGDTITTYTGVGYNFRQVEILDTTIIPAGITQLLLAYQLRDTAAGNIAWWLGPYAWASLSEVLVFGSTPAAGYFLNGIATVPLRSRRIQLVCRAPAANTSLLVVRLVGMQ